MKRSIANRKQNSAFHDTSTVHFPKLHPLIRWFVGIIAFLLMVLSFFLMTPEPPDKSNREEVKRIIREAIIELNLRLPFALQTDDAITRLADEALWAARHLAQLSLESPLHEKCVAWLKKYAAAHLPALSAQMTNSVSYTPIG